MQLKCLHSRTPIPMFVKYFFLVMLMLSLTGLSIYGIYRINQIALEIEPLHKEIDIILEEQVLEEKPEDVVITEKIVVEQVIKEKPQQIPPYITLEVEVTAYTAGYESTRKRPGHPAYGITKNGSKVLEGYTIAAPNEFPFGTKIYIPGYGLGEVQDRGNLIKWDPKKGKYVLDVYIEDLDRALEWGRKTLHVKVYTDNLTIEQINKILRVQS